MVYVTNIGRQIECTDPDSKNKEYIAKLEEVQQTLLNLRNQMLQDSGGEAGRDFSEDEKKIYQATIVTSYTTLPAIIGEFRSKFKGPTV